MRQGRRIGLIGQIPVYPEGWTTEDVLREAHSRLRAMAARAWRSLEPHGYGRQLDAALGV